MEVAIGLLVAFSLLQCILLAGVIGAILKLDEEEEQDEADWWKNT